MLKKKPNTLENYVKLMKKESDGNLTNEKE